MERLWHPNKRCVLSASSCWVTLYVVAMAVRCTSLIPPGRCSYTTRPLILPCNLFWRGISEPGQQGTVKPPSALRTTPRPINQLPAKLSVAGSSGCSLYSLTLDESWYKKMTTVCEVEDESTIISLCNCTKLDIHIFRFFFFFWRILFISEDLFQHYLIILTGACPKFHHIMVMWSWFEIAVQQQHLCQRLKKR